MIPVNEPLFGDKEKEYLLQCIDEKWISSEGPFVRKFEEAMASFLDVSFGVAVSNGTAALEVALAAIELQPGDEVIMPTFTIISCAIAVTRLGGIPVLVDCEPDTWNMDIKQIENRITQKTKAILPVHIYGHPVDMDPLLDLATKYGLFVIEDAAEAHGAEYKGKKCGALGHIGCFSFYANKIITTGEGGMLVTRDKHLADRSRSIRNLCFGKERRFVHAELGNNFRMSNLQAAVGVAQMERIAEFVQIKRTNAQRYLNLLQGIQGIHLPVEKTWARSIYWMFGVVLDPSCGMEADMLAGKLLEKGIQTRPFFYPLHLQPAYHRLGLFGGESYPVSEEISRYGLYLPSGLALTQGQIEYVGMELRNILSTNTKEIKPSN